MLDVIAIDPTTTGLTLPSGITLEANSQAYNLSTTAATSGPMTVCLQVPTVIDYNTFIRLRLLHGEGPNLVDRTSAQNYQSRQVCGHVTSLSPFVIGLASSPTAASVTISGRVTTAKGFGVGMVWITLLDTSTNETRTTQTTGDGSYVFTDVAAGSFYIISARGRGFSFSPDNYSFNLIEELQGVNFMAIRQ